MKMTSLLMMLAFTSIVNAQNSDEWLFLRKGACMGKCPIFEITVNETGLMTFHGQRFVDKEGIFQRQLTKKEFRKLKCKLRKAKIQKLDDEYGANVMDLSMTEIRYDGKTIKSKLDTPEKLEKAIKYLTSLTPMNKEGEFQWKQINETVEEAIKGRIESTEKDILVQLSEGVIIDEWLKKYSAYNVKVKRNIAPNLPIYLLEFNSKRIQANVLLEKFQNDGDVKSAEMNKKVEMR